MDGHLNFICGVCKKSDFININAFLQHVKLYPNNAEGKFLCLRENCQTELKNYKGFEKHMKNHLKKGNLYKKKIVMVILHIYFSICLERS